jgi:hypothetical protein
MTGASKIPRPLTAPRTGDLHRNRDGVVIRSLHEFVAVDEDEIRVKDSTRFTSLKEVGEHLGVDQLVNRDLLVSLFKIGD